MTKGRYSLMAITVLVVWAIHGSWPASASAQGRRARREARVAESEKPRGVTGGVQLESKLTYDATYDATLNHLKRQGYALDSSDRDGGQIVTALQVAGGYKQTGTRVRIVFIKESPAKTAITVAVTVQRRKKALQAEPWSEPALNQEESAKLAEGLKPVLEAQRGTVSQ